MGNLSEAIELIFQERREFIIIGLTGRTGSGCTTISNLLEKTFDELFPPKPIVGCCENNEERKYDVVYNYAKKNWKPFVKIQMSNIITSFILEYNYETFSNMLTQEFEKKNTVTLEQIKDEFDTLYIQRSEIREKIENKTGDLASKEFYKFYFEDVPLFTGKLREAINGIEKNLFTKVYQTIGNNVRKSGEAYVKEFNPKNVFRLSQRTNKLIKMLRQRNLEDKTGVVVVIDALRNPFEVNFFKDRYSSFYLFSVNAEESMRRNRLINKCLTIEQIDNIDKVEYPEKIEGEEQFYSLNIKACLELADVHLYNPTEQGNSFDSLKRQLVRYVSLIMHPGLITPTHLERCMQIAYNAKFNSGCLSRQVGAVVAGPDYSIKSVGWNSTPEGQVPCNLRNLQYLTSNIEAKSYSDYELYDDKYRKFLKKNIGEFKVQNLKGRLFPYCFKDAYNAQVKGKNQVHTRSLHAEENAFLQVAKNGGMPIKGGYLFTTASPCELCAKKAYHLGITKIYYIDPYPGISKNHILSQGNARPEMILFYGAVGRAYNQFYTPIMPYKDELYTLLDFQFKS